MVEQAEIASAAPELKAQRIALAAAVAFSIAWIVVDGVASASFTGRPDLALELAARVAMVGVVVVGLRATHGAALVYRLLWAIALLSMDTYWQIAYHRAGGRPLEIAEMLVKYVAVGAGLALLLQVCALFGDGPRTRVRAVLAAASIPAGAVLGAIGIWHGVAYARGCHFFVHGDGCVTADRWTLASADAYLAADALLRIAIVIAAIESYRRASEAYKERTLLVAAAAVVLSAGTALNFIVRPWLAGDVERVLTPSVIDATTTLVFPLALWWAATRNQLFDVEYTVRRGLGWISLASVVFIVWQLVFVATEAVLHQQIDGAAERLAALLQQHGADGAAAFLTANRSFIPSAAAVLPFLFSWRKLDERIAKPVEDFVFPVRARRAKALKDAVERIPFATTLDELNEILDAALAAIAAQFTNLMLHDGGDAFRPYRWTRHARNPYPEKLLEGQPPISDIRGRHVCLACADPLVPDIEVLALMVAAGKRCGVLVCGRPAREEVRHFAPDDLEHLLLFASMAANALVLHGAAPPVERAARHVEGLHA